MRLSKRSPINDRQVTLLLDSESNNGIYFNLVIYSLSIKPTLLLLLGFSLCFVGEQTARAQTALGPANANPDQLRTIVQAAARKAGTKAVEFGIWLGYREILTMALGHSMSFCSVRYGAPKIRGQGHKSLHTGAAAWFSTSAAFVPQPLDPAVHCRWKRASEVYSPSAMCGLGQSSGWARQSVREQQLWRDYMPFSQLAPLRRDSSSISDHTLGPVGETPSQKAMVSR